MVVCKAPAAGCRVVLAGAVLATASMTALDGGGGGGGGNLLIVQRQQN